LFRLFCLLLFLTFLVGYLPVSHTNTLTKKLSSPFGRRPIFYPLFHYSPRTFANSRHLATSARHRPRVASPAPLRGVPAVVVFGSLDSQPLPPLFCAIGLETPPPPFFSGLKSLYCPTKFFRTHLHFPFHPARAVPRASTPIAKGRRVRRVPVMPFRFRLAPF